MENKNLTKIALMQGLNEQEISLILNCLQAKIKNMRKVRPSFRKGRKLRRSELFFLEQ